MKRTPWGELRVADAHVHFFSHNFFSLLAAQAKRGTAEVLEALPMSAPAEDPAELAAVWDGELERHGVERAALIASLPGDESSVAAAVEAFPERFFGYFMANPLGPDAPARVKRAFDEQGLQGLCLFPAMQGYSLHDERARALIEIAAARPGTVVFVHCGVLSVGIRAKLGLASPFDMRFSNPIDVHGLALAYPKLPFVVPHFGAGYLREALMVAGLCPNVYLDTSSSNNWRRYLEQEMTLAAVFARALAVCGPGRLLFGTDSSFFPRGWQGAIFDEQVMALREAGVDEAGARAIFGGNLEGLLARRG
ncbi:MAG: amidohydrolase family protein [Acidobacteria bacterium]|nr:amidohydrolase family protein [Acidobacteriota bacterium]